MIFNPTLTKPAPEEILRRKINKLLPQLFYSKSSCYRTVSSAI